MIKKKLLYLFITSILSCKENEKQEVKTSAISIEDSIAKNIIEEEKVISEQKSDSLDYNIACDKILLNFIKTTSIDNAFKDSFTFQIEDINTSSMKIMLYEENNVVGTLLLDAQNFKILDLTYDIENPEELKYDIKKWNSVIDCYFKKNNDFYISNNSIKNNECKTTQSGMDYQEICNLKNTTIETVYQEIISKKLVENANTLLRALPTKNYEQKVNNKGLISNTYTVKQNSATIEMFYAGGVTTITLEQEGNNVRRTMLNSAD